MKIMTEQTVNNVTAKLAKEKGFNYPTRKYINNTDIDVDDLPIQQGIPDTDWNQNPDLDLFSVPSQTLLQKWLMDTHKVDVVSFPVRYTGYVEIGYWTYSIKGVQPVGRQVYKFHSYEEALEVGLETALDEL